MLDFEPSLGNVLGRDRGTGGFSVPGGCLAVRFGCFHVGVLRIQCSVRASFERDQDRTRQLQYRVIKSR